ncbi:MAG: hypothetical protein LBB72_04220 [Spirochaetaceae bacterium]|nr:hypothetical protein [Spirochaetaceae bacterium]
MQKHRSETGYKVFFLTAVFTLVVASVAQAQLMHDPNSGLYKDIDTWVVRGYIIRMLPMIRPYPLQVLDELLADVVDNGDEQAVQKALRYRDALLIGDGPRNSGPALYAADSGNGVLHMGVTGSVEGRNGDAGFIGGPFADGTLRLKDWLTGSMSVYGFASTNDPDLEYNNVPGSYSPYPDMIRDDVNVSSLLLLHNWTSALAFGTSEMYFQTGLVRSSFGPFYDNGVVIGPQAPKAGHFSLVYRQPKWSFEILWLELIASDTTGHGRFSEKHLVSHVLNFRPIPAIEFAFFEAMVWGPRIEPFYLIPFSVLFFSGAMADFGDNSFMGLNFRWFCTPGLQFLTQVYVDDIHFNDFVRFRFNTKLKVAAELGLVWAPKDGPLRSLAADYTAVTPYTYTHVYDLNGDYDTRYPSQGDPPLVAPHNYQDYSHAGKNLGPDLQPNSDRISLRSVWKILPDLDVGVSAYFTRHGNASENRLKNDFMNKEEEHDGSIFDDGNDDKPNYDSNYRELRFLTQPIIETKLAGGITINWLFPSRFGEFSLNAAYTAEYGWNRGLVPDSNSLVHYWAVGGTFRY